ncbi:MAG: (Fe-S)-binding protein [Armatimonadetes bacterium]|nr:(Fe-S)-binding protein [Armatimonadota bacterium]
MLNELDRLTFNCIKCGYCKAACPVYKEIGEEAASPRGRVRLIRGVYAGDVSLSQRYRKLIELCISCRACTAECPSGVSPNQAVLNARHHLAIECGIPLIKRLIFRRAMTARRMFPASAKLLGFLQRAIILQSRYSPARLILPILGLPFDKAIPYFQLKTFRDRMPEVIPTTNRKYRVAYFVGCGANLIYPEIGEAVVNLLTYFGVEVVIPRKQMCCGTPVFTSGDFEGATHLARQNLKVLSNLDVDAIITACGSCGTTIKHEWHDLLGIEVPSELTSKVYDITEFLTDCLAVSLSAHIPKAKTITYHDPCHLVRGMGVQNQPRKLLSSLADTRYVELASADTCCGGGGAYSIYHPDMSRKIGARKVDNVLKTEADLVATGCPVCILQLREMFSIARILRQVEHTAVVLNRALKEKSQN